METKSKHFPDSLSDFQQGQLCYVVARRYQGKGAIKLILHSARATGQDAFLYGAGDMPHWIVGAGTLMGAARSKKKSAASIKNGSLGGRPKNPPKR